MKKQIAENYRQNLYNIEKCVIINIDKYRGVNMETKPHLIRVKRMFLEPLRQEKQCLTELQVEIEIRKLLRGAM